MSKNQPTRDDQQSRLDQRYEDMVRALGPQRELISQVTSELQPNGPLVKISQVIEQRVRVDKLIPRMWDKKPYYLVCLTLFTGETVHIKVFQSRLYSRLAARTTELPFHTVIVPVQEGDGRFHYDLER